MEKSTEMGTIIFQPWSLTPSGDTTLLSFPQQGQSGIPGDRPPSIPRWNPMMLHWISRCLAPLYPHHPRPSPLKSPGPQSSHALPWQPRGPVTIATCPLLILLMLWPALKVGRLYQVRERGFYKSKSKSKEVNLLYRGNFNRILF